jgi:putative FmdB family regulatory protein
MWKVYDYECQDCSFLDEHFINTSSEEPILCEKCGSSNMRRCLSSPAVLTKIVPSYPGSKRVKAGYQHTHNRPAEKAASQVSMYKPNKG